MSRRINGLRVAVRSVTILSVALMGLIVSPPVSHAATSGDLTRYPYLTDSGQASITINWATDTTAGTTGSVTWGPAGGNCALNSKPATRTSVTVIAKAEYQWAVTIPVSPDTTYCYRVLLGTIDLLGSDASPVFTSQVAAGSTAPFSFAVFGDWGQAYAGGVNADQTNVLQQISVSGARFAVMTGDTAYPGGGQTEYGDLLQAGLDQSTVFGPTFWGIPGRSIPVFNVTGNHGFTNGTVQVTNWPETQAAATSGGKYQMESYPSINGSTAKSYPSMWYAVDAGPARLYMLTTAWSDANLGTGSVYQNDHDAHWTPGVAEYEWLKADLEAHPNALKFAFWHYPLYADSSSQPSDTFLQGGSGTLQGLLDQNNVAIVFNGHAHGYERNKPDSAGLVSYVLGNGGAALGSVSGCSSFDLYAIGAKGSHCGGAPAGQTDDHVYGFAKVMVNGRQVTVTPTDELGRTYDVQTYSFPASEPDSIPPTAPTTVTATVISTSKISLSWSGATDNVGVTGYRVLRDGVQIVEQPGASYTDATVTPDTSYRYTIEAVDAAGNVSPESAPPATASTTGSPDGTPPTQPGSLTAAARSSSVVDLNWAASTDNVGVTGYRVFRNGVELTTPTAPDATPPTTYTDETAAPATTYTYQVSAVDAAGNESTKASASVTTPTAGGGGATVIFTPTDDATVDASQPTVNFGGTARVTVDNSPVNNALLKFNVVAGCPIASAKLLMTVGTNTDDKSVYGGDLYGVTDTTWAQSTVTYNNAPAAAGAKTSSVATGVALNTTYVFDVTSLVTGDGKVSFLIKSTSSDGARYFSSEGSATQGPQLQVTCGTGGGPPPTVPGPPSGLTASAGDSQISLSWTAPVSNGGASITGYSIYRSTVTGAETLLKSVGNVTSTTDSDLTNGTQYFYKVAAVNSAGTGGLSGEASATPVSTITTPGPPTAVMATGADTKITLNWAAPLANGGSAITGYSIYRATVPGGEGASPYATVGNVLTYDDLAVTNGDTFYYKVTATNAIGESTASAEVSATPGAVPDAPTNLVASAIAGQVGLTWTAPSSDGGSGITGYQIWRGTTAGGETLLTTTTTATSYTDNAVINGTTYYYEVAAVNAVGPGRKSNEDSATPVAEPGAPASLTLTSGDGQVGLSWTAPTSDGGSAITGYSVYRGTAAGSEAPLTTLGNVTTFIDTGVTNGTTYFYTVTAANAQGEGPQSTEKSATPDVPATAPGSPTALDATAGAGQVSLIWTAPSSDGGSAITGYQIWRSTTSGSESLQTTTPSAATSYTDAGLTNGTTYYYEVAAVNAVGGGNLSNEDSATPVAGPGAPTGLTATRGNGQVSLSWTAPSSNGGSAITAYKIYRSTTAGAETLLASPAGTGTSYIDPSLTNGTTYFYKVTAVNGAGEGPRSSEANATPATNPGVPGSLSATGGAGQVGLSWTAAAANGATITSYKVYRGTLAGGEALVATIGNVTAYTDSAVTAGTTYYYKVSAVNGVGEGSASSEANATATAPPALVTADFEAGTMTGWTVTGPLTASTLAAHTGTFGARDLCGSAACWAYRPFTSNQTATDLWVKVWVNVQARDSNTTNLFKLRSSSGGSGAAVFGILLDRNGKLSSRNDVVSKTTTGTALIAAGWHSITVHLRTGTSGHVDVWLDGAIQTVLSKNDNLGTAAIGKLQLGENSSGRKFDVRYDDITASTAAIP